MHALSIIIASVLPIMANHNEVGGIQVVTNTVEYVTSATNDAVTGSIAYSTNYTASVAADKRDLMDLSIYRAQYSDISAVYRSSVSTNQYEFSFIGENADFIRWDSPTSSLLYRKAYSSWYLYPSHDITGTAIHVKRGDNKELSFTMTFMYEGSVMRAVFTRDRVTYPVKDGNKTLTHDGNILNVVYSSTSTLSILESSSFIIDAYNSGWPVYCRMPIDDALCLLHLYNTVATTNAGTITYSGYFSGLCSNSCQSINAVISATSEGSKSIDIEFNQAITPVQFTNGLHTAYVKAYSESTNYTSSALSSMTNRYYLADKGDFTSKGKIAAKWAMFGHSRTIIEDYITGKLISIRLSGPWSGSRGYCSKLILWINDGVDPEGSPDDDDTTIAAISDNVAYEVNSNRPIIYNFSSGVTIPQGSRIIVSFCATNLVWDSVKDKKWSQIASTYPSTGSMMILSGVIQGDKGCQACDANNKITVNKCLEAEFRCISPTITEKSVIKIASSLLIDDKFWNLSISKSEYIPSGAYRSAYSLHSVTSMPGAVIDVGTKSFAYLPNLKYIHIDTVADNESPIADDAFQDLNLDSLTVLNRLGDSLYCDNARGFAGAYARILNVPAATGIKAHSFEGSYIERANIQGVRNVEDSVFKNCLSLSRVEAPNCTNLCYHAMFNCTSTSELLVGLLLGLGSTPTTTLANMGQNAALHSDGKRAWVFAKNTASDFLSRFGSSGMGGLPSSGKIYCYDGYIVNNGTSWVSHSYDTVSNLPSPGSAYYVYKVGSRYYRWNGSGYSETDNSRLIGFLDTSGPIPKINAVNGISGSLKFYYETDSLDKLPHYDKLGTLTWGTL